MNRKVEKKLKKSLSIVTPKEKKENRSTPKLSYGYALGSLLLAVFVFVFFTQPLIFNESSQPNVQGVRLMQMEQNVDLSLFPWRETAEEQAEYQVQKDHLYITKKVEEVSYQIMLEKQELLVGSKDKSSKVEGQLLYLYQSNGTYSAKWQHQEFVITVLAKTDKNAFLKEIKQIIKENIK